MNSIYNEELHNFSNAYLIKGNEHLINPKEKFDTKLSTILNRLAEQFLIHESITIKVYGPNLPLALLINLYGLKTVEELLEQDALKFMLWSPGVATMVDTIPEILPLQSMGRFEGVYGDPEQSIDEGLKCMTNTLPRRNRRDLTRKLLKSYIVPPEKLGRNAVTFGHEGYKSNLFCNLGLENDKDIHSLTYLERQKLVKLATQCYDLSIFAKYNIDTYNQYDILQLTRNELDNLKNLNSIETVVDKLLEIEKIPDLYNLFTTEKLEWIDIPNLRKGRHASNFRKWVLNNSDKESSADVAKAYIDSISKKSFLQTGKGKALRFVGLTAAGTILGGPVGTGAGIAIDTTLSLFDSYILEHLSKGWSPKFYIDEKLKPKIQ